MLVNVSLRQIFNVIGDEGLKVLGKTCNELKHLQIEDDDACYISHNGTVAISQGCAKLQYLASYVCDITNIAFGMVGQVVSTSHITVLCLEKGSILHICPWMMV